MSIWKHLYESSDTKLVERGVTSTTCTYCMEKMDYLGYEYDQSGRAGVNLTGKTYHLSVCPICGWWSAWGSKGTKDRHYYRIRKYGSIGILKNLDIRDISTPINEAQSYLAAKYESHFQFDPKLFEDTVANIFKCIGYDVEITAVTKDGGIDVILVGQDDIQIGVQVKRTKRTISVSQIRELVGALILEKYTKGIFVTTSYFSPSAKEAAEKATNLAVPIELYDCKKFFDFLKIERRKRYTSREEFSDDIGHPSLVHLIESTSISRGYPQWLNK